MEHEASLKTLPDLCNSYILEGLAQVKIEYAHVQLCMYIHKAIQLKFKF